MAHAGPSAALRGPRVLLLAPILLLVFLLSAAGTPARVIEAALLALTLAFSSLALVSLIALFIIIRHRYRTSYEIFVMNITLSEKATIMPLGRSKP
jgi:hypothetical protein